MTRLFALALAALFFAAPATVTNAVANDEAMEINNEGIETAATDADEPALEKSHEKALKKSDKKSEKVTKKVAKKDTKEAEKQAKKDAKKAADAAPAAGEKVKKTHAAH
jgi:hypothetical protein